ncbi:PIG-L deacetylase family protein [Litoreibacter albidus]|uniref:N-acetylglucosaminyl deacetylase, LmbE family n=1 Tax=Litoreibacter albidus TaxID=670155 RepID=A0A1H3DN02_9RHOB|nr:PIG-L deacetylase family protein [Litoreibacter albidus]SDX67468.1 N-acetylglucosaminyl deacetylase, LmbE family [Litoreibacter albidus]
MILESRKTLVVVAHPDDETLGAGGTIRRLADAGSRVDLLVASDGSSAQFGDDMAARKRRNTHLDKACEILGINRCIILDLPDMRLDTIPHIEINRAIGKVAAEEDYDTILTHHPGDVNKDHEQVFNSVMVVARPVPGSSIRNVATFFVNSSTEWGAPLANGVFLPNLFVDIDSTIDHKLEALAAYEDELRVWPHPRSVEAVRARTQTVGSEVGVGHAEAFQLIRGLIRAPGSPR